ncbi:MAG: hypothetical protein AAFV38_09530 [Pseudomonadota bacterium]
MRLKFAAILSAFAFIVPAPGIAQVTLDQLDSAMATAGDAMEAFRVRLQDPNPAKALAAMRLLIAQGDDAQRRLAIAHGFEATDPAMRLEAVRGILDAKPLLLFRWTTENDTVNNNYKNTLKRFSGDFESGTVSRVPIQVGDYSEEKGCWTLQMNGSCFARLNSGELSLTFTGTWAQFVLNPEGWLVGRPNISGYRVDAVADLTK